MASAFASDPAKIALPVSSTRVKSVLSVPFDWFALHTVGGSLVSVAIGVVLVRSEERTRVVGLFGLGAASHPLADALLVTASGRSYPLLWPLSAVHPPTPGLYLSTDPKPMLAAALVAGIVCVATYRSDR